MLIVVNCTPNFCVTNMKLLVCCVELEFDLNLLGLILVDFFFELVSLITPVFTSSNEKTIEVRDKQIEDLTRTNQLLREENTRLYTGIMPRRF